MALYAEIGDKNPNWKKVYADYAKFRADQNLVVPLRRSRLRRLHAGPEALTVPRLVQSGVSTRQLPSAAARRMNFRSKVLSAPRC